MSNWKEIEDILKRMYDIIDDLKALEKEEKVVREEVLEAFDIAIKGLKEDKPTVPRGEI